MVFYRKYRPQTIGELEKKPKALNRAISVVNVFLLQTELI